MNILRWTRILIVFGIAVSALGLLVTGLSANAVGRADGTVSGAVVDDVGPVAGARVRVRATDNVTLTNDAGRFTLGSLVEGHEIEVTAWANGYYIASTHVTPTIAGITLSLRAYHTTDNPDYEWTSPVASTSDGACGNCHPLILPQWITNAHGSAVSNPRFFSLYNGTDLNGTAPAGPGYLNDFPGTAGNCANCHAPGAAVDGYLTTDMNAVRDQVTAGIHCDYCHKVGGVYLDPVVQSVYPNAPGVRSQRVLRPPEGDNIFFGPYDDIHDPDTYLPAMTQSQFCAPCHQFSFWGTPIYESYEEWLASPYADAGVTCQDCHMPPTGDRYFALPEVGGLEHPPDRIPSHLQLGAMSTELLQDAVTMTLSAQQVLGRLRVTVIITNTGAGHHVPTDHPGRHMILVVTATEEQGQAGQGQALPLRGGPTVPEWGGAQAGLPGKAFAKMLRDVESGESPVISYWKQALIESDNRIPSLGSDTSVYTFKVPAGGEEVNVTARLIFRRVFQSLADLKGWDAPDIVMAETTESVSLRPAFSTYLPLVAVDVLDK